MVTAGNALLEGNTELRARVRAVQERLKTAQGEDLIVLERQTVEIKLDYLNSRDCPCETLAEADRELL